jgi:hypothetical protein
VPGKKMPSFKFCQNAKCRTTGVPGHPVPRAFAKSQTHPLTYRLLQFLGLFFLVRFWASLGWWSSKTQNTTHIFAFYKKSMPKTFPKQIDKKFDVRFSSFFFNRVFGCFSAMSYKKIALQKDRVGCRKVFSNKNRQKIQNRFFSIYFLSCFWAFLGEGSLKTPQKYGGKSRGKSDPGPLTHPHPTGSPIFLFFAFCRPLGACSAKNAQISGVWWGLACTNPPPPLLPPSLFLSLSLSLFLSLEALSLSRSLPSLSLLCLSVSLSPISFYLSPSLGSNVA